MNFVILKHFDHHIMTNHGHLLGTLKKYITGKVNEINQTNLTGMCMVLGNWVAN